jgi:putative peptidoglycan lipid II flippase
MSLARDVTTVGGATLASRLLGFARDMAIAAMLGAGALSDAFFAVCRSPISSADCWPRARSTRAFVPVWLRIKQIEGRGGAYRFFHQVFSRHAARGRACCGAALCVRTGGRRRCSRRL